MISYAYVFFVMQYFVLLLFRVKYLWVRAAVAGRSLCDREGVVHLNARINFLHLDYRSGVFLKDRRPTVCISMIAYVILT
jgi:hypothetical protein